MPLQMIQHNVCTKLYAVITLTLWRFPLFSPTASTDFTAQNDTYQFSNNALFQCTPIAITSDSVNEPGQECFTFTISSPTSVAGLTLSPSETEICISDSEGKTPAHQHHYTCIIIALRKVSYLTFCLYIEL